MDSHRNVKIMANMSFVPLPDGTIAIYPGVRSDVKTSTVLVRNACNENHPVVRSCQKKEGFLTNIRSNVHSINDTPCAPTDE
jgi:hypothetical protein